MSVVTDGAFHYERDPERITAQSFQIIRKEVDTARFGAEAAIATRIVHAAGDTAIARQIVISGGVCGAVGARLAAGAPVIVDSEMTRHAIMKRAIDPQRVVCRLNDPETAPWAKREKTTRSAAAIRLCADIVDGAIIVIGNAPTALFELLAMMREGAQPAVIFAFPVGFVGAAESKAALVAARPTLPFVTLKGRRGGSAMAGAALNAAALSAAAEASQQDISVGDG
ncbi:MAG: precorrin-8X methylmutase [Pseudomonadota bacterium]